MAVLDNISIGILMKVNDLAARYGLEITDFLAELKIEKVATPSMGGLKTMTGRSILEYAAPPDNPSKRERFELMLETLGISNDTGKMVATDSEIMQALNKALEVAPRAWRRG